MARPEKEAVVQEVSEIFQNATGVFVTDFKGLDVEKLSELRKQCREKNVGYRVVKNTLARIAAENTGFKEMVEYLEGPSAIAYSYDDPSAPARVITEFARKMEKPTIKMTLFEGVFYGPEKIQQIAELPGKKELLAMVVGTLNAPVSNLVGGLNGILRKLVGTLDAVRAAKDEGRA